MANLTDQTIILTLCDESAIGITTPPTLIPCHFHKHSELIGLGNDDHPQYLTYERGQSLFLDLFNLNPTEGTNVGAGVPLFVEKEGITLKFKTIVQGTNVTITEQDDTITIEAAGGVSGPADGGTFP